MTERVDRSLTRLQTDRVDLLQLHSCSEDVLRKGDVIGRSQRYRRPLLCSDGGATTSAPSPCTSIPSKGADFGSGDASPKE